MNTTDVLIVGAGPTGLTLACDLARRGIACRIIDKADRHSSDSRAKTIQPRALEVADDLGAVERIIAMGATHIPTRHYDRDRVISEAVEAAVGVRPAPTVPYPAPVWVAQPYVEAALRDRLAQFGGSVRLGTEVVALEQHPDSVTVTARTGQQWQARYVVGCDGGRSVVRGSAGIALDGTSYERHRWYLGDMRVSGLERGRQHVWMSSTLGILSLFPLPHTDLWQFQASVPADDETPPEPSLELYRRIFTDRAGLAGVKIEEVSWLSLYRINVCVVDRYRAGRVFLAGDAAHIHSPGGGQGMNTGIQDAYNLGWKLAAVLTGADDALLDTYEHERLPVARAVLGDSTAKLHMVMRAAAADDGSSAQRNLTDDFTAGLTIAYPDSPLTDRAVTPAAGAGPGERAPDARCREVRTGNIIRLFDLFRGTHWTLLAFGDHPIDATDRADLHIHRIGRFGVATEGVIDIDGLAYDAYSGTDGEMVLVRPDGYIATRATSFAAIDAFLGKFAAANP